MAFNKISMVFLVLLVAATMANARLFESEISREKIIFSSSCECTEEHGKTRCYRSERKVGGCPAGCSESACACTRMRPPTCWCAYEVDTCSNYSGRSVATTATNVLGFNGGYN